MFIFKIFVISILFLLISADFDFEIDEDDSKPEEIGTMQLFEHVKFVMGCDERTYASRGESPKRWEYTKPFKIDRYPVTVADFQNFVNEKEYHTTQSDINKYSFVFYQHLKKNTSRYEEKYAVTEPWFIPVATARWDKPFGEYMNISKIKLNPVTHVGFADAYRYCEHLNKRLPTEYEWELAARTNNFSWDYPWGPGMRRNRMNIWQGMFPNHDHGYDGYTHVSPVNAFPPQNNYGMYDMLGNVWEWTTTEYYGSDLPPGKVRRQWVVQKGGSFLDSITKDVKTSTVRSSIKIGRPFYYTSENVGFRCAQSIIKDDRKPRIIRYEDTREYRKNVEKLAKKFIFLKEKINRTKIVKSKPVSDHVHYFDLKDEL